MDFLNELLEADLEEDGAGVAPALPEENYSPVAGYDVLPYADGQVVYIENKTIGDLSKQIVIEGESKSQYIIFERDRYVDGIDLTTMTMQVHWERDDKYGSNDKCVNVEASENKIRFGWVIPLGALKHAGILKVMPFAYGVLPNGETYIHKELYAKMVVQDGLVIVEGIDDPDNDFYTNFMRQIAEYTAIAKQAEENSLQYQDTAKSEAEKAAASASSAADSETKTREMYEDVLEMSGNIVSVLDSKKEEFFAEVDGKVESASGEMDGIIEEKLGGFDERLNEKTNAADQLTTQMLDDLRQEGEKQLSDIETSGNEKLENLQNVGDEKMQSLDLAAENYLNAIEEEGGAQVQAVRDASAEKIEAEGEKQKQALQEALASGLLSIEEEGTEQKQQIESAAQTAINSVTEEGNTQSQMLENTGTEQSERIEQAGDTQEARIETAASEQIKNIEDTTAEKLSEIESAGAVEKDGIASAGQEQKSAVESAGQAQVKAVETAGQTQKDAVIAEGAKQIEIVGEASKEAESYAHGKTGTREGEDTDNAEYYKEQSEQIYQAMQAAIVGALVPKGTITFSQLPEDGVKTGWMYNITDSFTSDTRFLDGGNVLYSAGVNVYMTDSGLWDVLTGTSVIGVKGDSEKSYRTGQVNITKGNIGLGNVPNVATNDQAPTFTQATTRENIKSGDKLSALFGKLMKWFSDLKAVAFSGSYNDLSDKPTIPSVPGSMKNPHPLTFTGGSDAVYDGSVAKTVKIPSVASDVGALSSTGKATTAGTSDKVAHALTFTGGSSAVYDGSSAQSVKIPSTPEDVGALASNGKAATAGAADTAAKLAASKTIGISGAVTGTATGFDGSSNITIPTTGIDVSKANAGVLPSARGGTGVSNSGALEANDSASNAWIGNVLDANSYYTGMRLQMNIGSADTANPQPIFYTKRKSQTAWEGQNIYTTAHKPTASDVGAVPTTRKVNNKALSADISLSASDVGALSSTGKASTAGTADKVAHALKFSGASTETYDGSANKTVNIPTYTNFGASGTGAKAGLVPSPGGTQGTTRYLREDGSWQKPPDNNTWTPMKGATSTANGSVGYVNATPPMDGYNTKYLRADGSWQIPPNTNTWKQNTASSEGYVAAGGTTHANQVWKCDGNGVPGWRADANTTYTSLKNPHALTFTNGATASYDGSQEVSVKIPKTAADVGALATTGGTVTGDIVLENTTGQTYEQYIIFKEASKDYPRIEISQRAIQLVTSATGGYRYDLLTFAQQEGYTSNSRLNGTATNADKATSDGNGNNIVNTYATKTTVGALSSVTNSAGIMSKPSSLVNAINQLTTAIATLNSNFPKWIHDNNFEDGLRISTNYFENISVVNGILTFSPAHMSLTEVRFATCESTMVPSNIIVSGFYNNSNVTCYMNVTQNGELYTGNINCIIFAVGI